MIKIWPNPLTLKKKKKKKKKKKTKTKITNQINLMKDKCCFFYQARTTHNLKLFSHNLSKPKAN